MPSHPMPFTDTLLSVAWGALQAGDSVVAVVLQRRGRTA